MPEGTMCRKTLEIWDNAKAALMGPREAELVRAFIEMGYQEGVIDGISACQERLETVFRTLGISTPAAVVPAAEGVIQ